MPKSARREPADGSPLTIPDVMRRLKCSRSHVERLILAGELEAADIGNGSGRAMVRISDASLELFLSRRRVTDAAL